jgi:hypothetical protein
MIGYVYEDFVQPAQGAFVSIHLESRSDLIIGLGFIQIGTAGVYNIIETRLHPNGRYNVAAIRLNSGIQCETETGGLIRRGEVARSLTLKQVRSLAVEFQSRPHGPLPDYLSSLATGWGDRREAYVFRHEPSLHPPDDSRFWRGECDLLIRQLIQRTPGLQVDETDAPTQLMALALQEHGLTPFELSRSLQYSSPYIDQRVVERDGVPMLRGRISFQQQPYRMSPTRIREILNDIHLYSSVSWDFMSAPGMERAIGFVRDNSKSDIPQGCRGCSNLHGKAYTGEHGRNMFICGMHPSGYEGEGPCPDRQ